MIIDEIKYRAFRNRYGIRNAVSKPDQVNLEYSRTKNLGDTLSPLIVNRMLEKKNLSPEQKVSRTKHLTAVGSVVGRGRFDVTVWGTGILKPRTQEVLLNQKRYRKYDIRAVRGPKTREMFLKAGYECPEVFGDPAILMPMIYPAESAAAGGKKYPVSLILHHRTEIIREGCSDEENFRFLVPKELTDNGTVHIIDPNTDDYQVFIDEIVQSERIISASLHGIILAEVYGVPATFLNFGVQDQEIKFHDWYESTGRTLSCEKELEPALKNGPLPLPQLSAMQKQIAEAFPYDLWDESLTQHPYRRAR